MIHHMEGIKGIGGGGRVGVGEDDMGDGMQCSDHPFRNNPGGICAFCLQEKLGKLVSSSFPLPIRASTSSSSSPSFRSDIAPSSTTHRPCASSLHAVAAAAAAAASTSSGVGVGVASSSSLSLSVCPTSARKNNDGDYHSRRTRLPFLLAKKKKKKASTASGDIILKRSKSTATPRRAHSSLVDADVDDFSPRKRNGFWSFLYHSSTKSSSASSSSGKKLNSKSFRDSNINNNGNCNGTPRMSTINTAATTSSNSTLTSAAAARLKDKCCSGSSLGRKSDNIVVVEEDNSPNSQNTASASSFERKVSRSRSVGCGSRSFSGDFFERISTGFGDCTLRRVESQREGKHKVSASATATISGSGSGAANHHHHCMKERVRCGGLFSGFMLTSSSSSSSSSSYWVSSSADDTVNGKSASTVAISHGRGKSWGWAFASPMRAFGSKPSSKGNNNNRRDIIRDANDKNATPNLSAIPSLLAARG